MSTEQPAAKRLSTAQKTIFGLGGMANGMIISGVNTLTLPIYNLILGVRPQWVGIATSIPLVYDAITDPVMGWISDNFRSRWGRRRPFIVAGAAMTGLSFALLWWCPQGWGEFSLFIYLLIASLVFYTAHKVWVIPYLSLGLGLTSEQNSRTSLWGYFTFFTNVASLGGTWLLALIESHYFVSSALAARWVGCAVGALTGVFAALPGMFLQEEAIPARKSGRARPFADMKSALQVAPFRHLALTILLLNAALNCAAPFGLYVVIYYLYAGNASAGATLYSVMSTVRLAAALSSLPLATRLANRFGKKPTLLGCLIACSVGFWSTLLTVTPAHPWLVVISAALIAPGATAPFQLYWSMLSDVCDWDELERGARRDGTFSALGNWFVKTAQGLVFLTSGVLLAEIGFDRNLGAHQSAETLLSMRLIWAVVPGVVALVACAVLWRYPITRYRAEAIRRELNGRSLMPAEAPGS
ncbi:MAG TPA: MFS transporter [Opitutaceae bacterium]|nr:MFS transporter [Opitutaceae bacterium]